MAHSLLFALSLIISAGMATAANPPREPPPATAEELKCLESLLQRKIKDVSNFEIAEILIQHRAVQEMFRNSMNGSDDVSRRTAIYVLNGIAKGDTRVEHRSVATDLVVEHMLTRRTHAQTTANRLVTFPEDSFSFSSKTAISNEIVRALSDNQENTHYLHNLIRIAGTANLRSESPRLRRVVSEHAPADAKGRVSRASLGFSALLALARLGDREAADECIELVEAHPSPDFRITALFRDLSYTRHPAVVEYLWTYLPSDILTTPDGRDVAPLPYWGQAAQALYAMLEGAPSPWSSTQAEWIAWMEAHKDDWPLKR